MQSGQSLDEIIRQSEGHGRRRGNGGGNRQSGRSNRSNYTDLDNVDSDNNNNGGGINDDDDGNQMEDIVMSDGQQRRRQPRSPYARNNSSNNSNSNNKRTLNRNNTGNNNNRSGAGGNSASGRSSGAGGSSGGSKILITNLAYSVTEEDLNELFGEFGGVRQAKLNYDQNGKSLGTATVTFAKSDAAQRAFEKYANVELDSRPMRISIPINPSLAPLPTSAAAAAAGFPTVMQPMGQIPMLHVAQLPQYPTTIPFTAAHPMSTLSSYGRGNARSSYNNNNNRNSNNNNRNDNRGRNQQSSNRSQRTSNQSHQQRAEQQKSSKTIADLDAELDSYMGNSN